MSIFTKLIEKPFYLKFTEFQQIPPPWNERVQVLKGEQVEVIAQKNSPVVFVKFLNQSFELSQKDFHSFLNFAHNTLEERKIQKLRSKAFSQLKSHKKNLSTLKKFQQPLQDVVKTITHSKVLENRASKLTKNSMLSNYTSILLISLEKGSSSAQVFDYSSGILNSKTIPSTLFNQIFSNIKKSTKNFFYDHETISTQLNLVGYVLAESFEIYNKNMIFILSKDEIIQPSLKEQTDFEDFVKKIKKALQVEEKDSETQDTLDLYLTLFKHLNHFVKVLKDNQTIYSNFGKNQKFKVKEFKQASTQFTMLYEDFHDDSVDKADLFQHQRIELLGELFNILRHELSNPLQGINLGLNMIAPDFKETEFREIMQEAQSASDRSLRIFSTMTDIFSSSENTKEVSFSSIMESVQLTLKSELKHVDYKVIFEKDFNIKNLKIKTKPSILNQILFNLVHNSVQELREKKADQEKIINLYVTKEKESSIQIKIQDNGLGFPPQLQKSLFKPKKSKKKGGSGLGLSISKSLSMKIGAHLELTQTSLKGSTFCLTIPLQIN